MRAIVEAEKSTGLAPRRAAEARSRGTLQIPQRVVQRIAAQAASEVAVAGGRSGGLLGIGARTDLGARPKVEATLSSDSVDLAIELAVSYPVSLRGATQDVREHVARRVQTLTGIAVHRIDIDIVAVGVEARNEGGGLR